MFSKKFFDGGVTRNISTVATAIARGMAEVVVVEQLERGAERGLDARVHHVDGIDLVEDQVGEEADAQEPGRQPCHCLVASQQLAVDPGGNESAEHQRQHRVPDTAVVAEAKEHLLGDEAHEQQRAEPQNQHLGNGIFALQAEQHREGEEHAEAGEHRARGARSP